ncbi:MAG: hypothetical protein G8345_00025 [Magnetococcales bacterium]|nr:hypothetical protein [Magnetococcales bacterium]
MMVKSKIEPQFYWLKRAIFTLLLAGCVTTDVPLVKEEMESCITNNCDPLILGGSASPEEMIDLAMETCENNGFRLLVTDILDEDNFRLYVNYFAREKIDKYSQLRVWREMYFLDPEFEVRVARFVPGMGDRSHGVRFASKHRVYCSTDAGFVQPANAPHTESGDAKENRSMVKAGMWHGRCFVRFRCRK